jgi:hypothetical protein
MLPRLLCATSTVSDDALADGDGVAPPLLVAALVEVVELLLPHAPIAKAPTITKAGVTVPAPRVARPRRFMLLLPLGSTYSRTTAP